MTDPATTPATQQDVAAILERVGSLEVSVADQMQTLRADLSRSFDLAIELIRHDLAGANSDRIAGLENRVGAIEQHVGLGRA
jgi:ABC-type phosphonate transport system ATPase subunit